MPRDNAAVPASTSETRLVPGAYDGVFNAVCHAAASSGMTVTLADPAAGVIQLSTSMGLATWSDGTRWTDTVGDRGQVSADVQ